MEDCTGVATGVGVVRTCAMGVAVVVNSSVGTPGIDGRPGSVVSVSAEILLFVA